MENRVITIFVHGTLPPRPVLQIPLVYNFFYCPQGLTRALDLDAKYHTAQFIKVLCESNPNQFDIDHFYIFGWNGFLRFSERKKSALELYKQLRLLKRRYNQESVAPLFKLITHSHGGNVALYLAPIAEEEQEPSITIDELILLACPVQVETAPYVNESIFTRVFSVHSHRDLLQVLDPQGIHSFVESVKQLGPEFTIKHLKRLGPLFSARHFIAAPTVTQLNVRYPNRELFHVEFLFPSIISMLPSLITRMKEHSKTELSKTDDLTLILQ